MPWKTDATTGLIAIQDGKPVYVYADGNKKGEEIPFDADMATGKIHQLAGESKANRERAEKAEGSLKAFEGLDPAAARDALDKLAKIDQKKLIDAGQVDAVRQEIKTGYEAKLASLQAGLDGERTARRSLLLGNQFKSSPYFVTTDGKPPKTVLPPEVAQSYLGAHCKVTDDNAVVVLHKAGDENSVIYSRIRPSEVADFDEAIGILLESHPNKDSLFRGSGAAGSGANPGNRNTTADTSNLPLEEQSTRAFQRAPN